MARRTPGGCSFPPPDVAHSRLGFAAVHPDETADSALAFLSQFVGFYGSQGIRIERVLTDNGSCFKRRWRMRASSTRSPSRRRAPIARRPTARPNALSARCSSAGRTPTPTSTSQSVWLLLAQHSTSTIASVPTAHMEASHPCSASSTSLGHTPSRSFGHGGQHPIRLQLQRLPLPAVLRLGQRLAKRGEVSDRLQRSHPKYATLPRRGRAHPRGISRPRRADFHARPRSLVIDVSRSENLRPEKPHGHRLAAAVVPQAR